MDEDKKKQNEYIQNLVKDTLKNVEPNKITEDTKSTIKNFNKALDHTNLLPTDDLKDFVKTLPTEDKDKVERYLDIFRDDISVVVPYIEGLKKYGSEKNAKKADETFSLPKLTDSSSEATQKRFFWFQRYGPKSYDINKRVDITGLKRKQSFQGKFSTKVIRGVGTAVEESLYNATRTAGAMVDAGLNTDILDYIENNWNSTEKKPEGIQQLAEDLTQFGISLFAGKKILKYFGKLAGKVAPNYTRRVVEKLSKKKPKLDKFGKPVYDKVGRVVETSSVAQKLGYWGVGAGVAYGVGEFVTGADDKDFTILGDVQPLGIGSDKLKLKDTTGMSGREKAAATLMNKLKYGTDGAALVGGLTVGGKYVLAPVIKGTTKNVVAPSFRFIGEKVLNPASKILVSERSFIPPLLRAAGRGKTKLGEKMGIPPMKEWGFYSTTAGPLKERILGTIDKQILTPIRSRGKLTPQAKDILDDAENLVRSEVKKVDLSLKSLEKKIYNLANVKFKDRVFTTGTNVAARQYLDDTLTYLRGQVDIDALPKVLRNDAKEIRKGIDELTEKLKPYIDDEKIKSEFIENMGKYLRNSYEIFRGSYKPDRKNVEAAVKFFVDGIKRTDPVYKDVVIGSGQALEKQLLKEARQKVDEILQIGQEGSSPAARMEAIAGITTPISNLIQKQPIPKVIQDLLGKVNDPRSIIIDTVTQQADLLAHLQVHRKLVAEGLKNGYIFRSQKEFNKMFPGDSATTLVPIRIKKNPLNIDMTDIYTYRNAAGNKVPYYTTKEMAEGIVGDSLITDHLLRIPFYKSYLAAKTTSQLTKTVLSLMTQMRNVETAAFFSFINGHLGKQASVIDALKIAFQDVTGKGGVNPNVMRKKLEEYLKYGVFDNSVVAGEVEALMKDIVKGRFATSDQLFNFLLKNPVFRKATEFYQAADNLWKAYGYEFTKSQLVPAIPVAGLTVKDAIRLGYKGVDPSRTSKITWQELAERQYKEVFNKPWSPNNLDGTVKTYGEAMREIAARYIRDVYPNYSMVPKIVQNWRRLPLGNFVAFQSEIIRNIYNILNYSTREMASSNPYLRQMGARRFLGFGTVLYGFDKTLQGVSSQLTGLDEEFIKGYQRFFSPWYAKNDQLIPVTNIDPITKKFKTIDWSKEQPFASVTDAFRVASEQIMSPNKTDANFFERFFKATIYDFDEKKSGSITKLFEPFINESILTEAILDVSPVRGGKTKEGKIIFDAVNEDPDVVIAKIFNHLIQTINPTTFKNAGRVLQAYDGQVSKAGQKYNTTNEILKLFLGIGIREEDPNIAFDFIVSDFSKRIRNADSQFTRDAVDSNKLIQDPYRILKLFEQLQENRYREMSRVADFLKVADKMFSTKEIFLKFKDRQNFGRDTLRYLYGGLYKPSNLPNYTDITATYRKEFRKLKQIYPDIKFEDILPLKAMNEIRAKWNGTPLGLSDEEIKEFHRSRFQKKDDKQSFLPSEEKTKQVASLPASNIKTPPLPETPKPVISNRKVAQISPITGLTQIEQALLSPSEQLIRQRQRT